MLPCIPLRLSFVLLTVVFLAGCAASPPAGRWEIDPVAQQVFESGTILPDHAYYYLGSYVAPDSIIAIHHRFTLRTRVWARVDLDQDMLDGWLQWYRSELQPPGCEYQGGVILAPDGSRAGFWYSQNVINLIYQPEPGVIEVYQPRAISYGTCGRDRDGGFSGRMD